MAAPLALDTSRSGLTGVPLQTDTLKVSQQGAAATLRRQDLDVTITTVDGDRFTLSADSVSSNMRATYCDLGATAAGVRITQSSAQFFGSSSSLSLSLEGNFSRDELHDIARALKEIGRILRDSASGHFKQSIHRVEKLAQADSLAGVQASYQQQTVAVAAQQTSVETGPPADATVAA